MLTLAAPNTYTGGTTVNGGTLQLDNAAAFGAGGLTVANGVVDLNAFGLTAANGNALPWLSGGSAGTITDNGYSGGVTTTLTVNQSTTTTFGGTIADGPSDLLSLAMTGPGKLVLSGTGAYSGGTFADDGILVAATASAIPAGGALTVGAGGTFIFDPTAAGGPVEMGLSAAGVAAVPEPGTLALLAAGAVLGFAAWRRKKGI